MTGGISEWNSLPLTWIFGASTSNYLVLTPGAVYED
jgi:hypothetical protein